MPELRSVQEYVGSQQPVLMDWAVGLAFPCQQPMLHANGVTEVPKFRITPDYTAKKQDTDTWEDGLNGGLLGITDLLLRAHVMATYLSRDWGRDWGSLRQFDTIVDAQPADDRTRHRHPQRAVEAQQDSGRPVGLRCGRPSSTGHRGRHSGRRMAGRPTTADSVSRRHRRRHGVSVGADYSPTFWGREHWRVAMQTWVVEVDGLTVLVDTGVGNDRDRPAMPPLDHLDTDFLDALAARRR